MIVNMIFYYLFLNPFIPFSRSVVASSIISSIYLGYPNWWGDMPMPLYTFLEAHNWSGKTIIPICTHVGSDGCKPAKCYGGAF